MPLYGTEKRFRDIIHSGHICGHDWGEPPSGLQSALVAAELIRRNTKSWLPETSLHGLLETWLLSKSGTRLQATSKAWVESSRLRLNSSAQCIPPRRLRSKCVVLVRTLRSSVVGERTGLHGSEDVSRRGVVWRGVDVWRACVHPSRFCQR